MATNKQAFHLRPQLESSLAVSRAVSLGNLLFLSGTKSLDENGSVVGDDVDTQIQKIYTEIGLTLKAHGAAPENVLKETIYCRDMDATFSSNNHRVRFYDGTEPPASTLVQVERLVFPDLLIEIDIIAEIPADPDFENIGLA